MARLLDTLSGPTPRNAGSSSAWQRSLVRRAGTVFLALAYACIVLASVSWIASPSATMSQALDPAWTLTWSATLAVCGIVCLVGRFTGRNVLEGLFSILAGVLIWCWSLIIINLGYTTQPSTLQAGWALMALAGLAVGWGLIEVAWAYLQGHYETLLLEELTRRVKARAATATDDVNEK